MWAYQGLADLRFSEKLVFFTSVLRFALLPYYKQTERLAVLKYIGNNDPSIFMNTTQALLFCDISFESVKNYIIFKNASDYLNKTRGFDEPLMNGHQ